MLTASLVLRDYLAIPFFEGRLKLYGSNTQEIDGEAFAELQRHHNAFGWIDFKPDNEGGLLKNEKFPQSASKKTARPQANGCVKGCLSTGRPK